VSIVNVDGERPLAVVRASGARSDISLGSQHFGVGVAIGADAGLLSVQPLIMLVVTHSIPCIVTCTEPAYAHFAGTFEIEDLLVGPKCRQHRYLARSYESLDTAQLPSVRSVQGPQIENAMLIIR
jgi:hypothetical protein